MSETHKLTLKYVPEWSVIRDPAGRVGVRTNREEKFAILVSDSPEHGFMLAKSTIVEVLHFPAQLAYEKVAQVRVDVTAPAFAPAAQGESPHVVVEVLGGLVTDARANVPGIEVTVVDWDSIKESGEEAPDVVREGVNGLEVDSERFPHVRF